LNDEIARRKVEHVEVALAHNIAAPQRASWNDIHLIHQALPEVDLDEIDIGTSFLEGYLHAPFFISSLTGGHPDVALINERLARAAQRYGIALGVGSQRAAILTPELAKTYTLVREQAPDAFLIANIGAPQLIAQKHKQPFTLDDIHAAIQMIEANALALHLNYLQEAAQPEGDRKARGALAAIANVTAEITVPVIAKETGAGISRETALHLKDAGVRAIDCGGAGGSSMAALEKVRANQRGDHRAEAIGKLFLDWGIATPISVVEASIAGLPLISTGGMRTGLDAARAIALGATLVGVGWPMLEAASQSDDAVAEFIETFLAELRVAMQLSGAASLAELQQVPLVVTGATRDWLELRGFEEEIKKMARR
jgi:isopentenyl-diphosphate Delta-isomerase